MLEVSGLSVRYRTGFWMKPYFALKDVSFSVQKGEVIGLVGSNGAGKTTLFKVLTGLLSPTHGHVTLAGRDPRLPSARGSLGFLPERPYFYEHLDATSYLMHLGALSGIHAKALRPRVRDALKQVSLESAEGKWIRTYSKGMLQRLGFAQALLHDPDFLILDEPMSGLDPRGRQLMRSLMEGVRDRGKTLLFSSHVLSDVAALCQRVLVLDGGRLVRDESLRTEEGTWEIETTKKHEWVEGYEAAKALLSKYLQEGEEIRRFMVAPDDLERRLAKWMKGGSQ
jgi:ABC-2 type transport system ATP-binding protein